MRDPAFKPFAKVKLFETRQRPRHRSRASPCQLAALRLYDLQKLFVARYRGDGLPNDDAGRDDMMVAINHCASLAHPAGKITSWLSVWCPWVTLAEREELIAGAILHQQHWTADQLAWRLRLTDADRTMLGITTIGAIDCSKRQRTKRRLAKQKERSARNRKERLQHKVYIGANANEQKDG